MTNRFSCTLNGVSPESVDAAARVTDMTELPPRMRVVTVPTPRHGLRLLRRVRESLTVRVSFIIAEYDPVRRREVCQKLHAWAARGGELTVSDRPGQRLIVECDTLPTMNALSWSDEMSIELTAYAVPFWEEAAETSVTTAEAAALLLPGTADACPVGAEVTNLGTEALTSLTLRCGDTQMTFEGMSVPAGGVFSLRHEGGVLIAEAAGESALMHRTDGSHDLLLADCGEETEVAVSGDQPVSAVFHGRGRAL